LILLVSFGPDRPAHGLITIRDRPLVEVQELIEQPPAFPGP
jgi:hypothetical protein